MTEIVINVCYGGFSISDAAVRWIRKNQPCGHKETAFGEMYDGGSGPSEHEDSNREHGDARTYPSLVAAVKKLGKKANGCMAKLRVVSIPDGIEWTVEEYDGQEWIAETHRTWR